MKSFSDYIIYSKAIKHNLNEYKKINNRIKICAVVKADAYGIGLKNVVTQINNNVDFFAVACFNEAKDIRNYTKNPVLVLNFIPIKNIDYCIQHNISISVSSLKQMQLVCRYLKKRSGVNSTKKVLNSKLVNTKLKIHFAINSGMNRIGFKSENEFYKAVLMAKKFENYINVEGIFTHFYNAISEDDTMLQKNIFMHFINILGMHFNLDNIIIHTQNSLSAVKYKNLMFDMARLGIILYGSLDKKVCKKYNLHLKQAVSVKSKLINITKIKKGEHVSYGTGFVAKKNMIVGTVPLGYADGIFRSFYPNGKVLVGGKFCKIVGIVCMDMFIVDLNNVKAKLFDEVVLIGKDKFNNKITIDDFANYCNTISYEVLTNLRQKRFNVKHI